jgi:hypothetical protein
MESRYDNEAYQKQVSLQMLATPTLEIACRAITDLRQILLEKNQRIIELERDVDAGNRAFTDAASLWQNATHDYHKDVRELEEKLKQFEADSIELNIAKRALLKIFVQGESSGN